MANERVSPFHCPGPEMVNKNLLDNWYFGNPVNQKGQKSYGKNQYCIDRWSTHVDAACTYDVETHIIHCSQSIWCGITQYVDDFEEYIGKTLTFSVLGKCDDGLYLRANYTRPGADYVAATDGSGYFVATLTFKVPDNAEVLNMQILRNHRTKDGEIDVIAAKLELGPVQTLAHLDSTGKWVLNEIPNYVEELNKCRYYYRVFDTEAQRTANNWGMRLANPTAGTIQIDGATKYTLDANL